MEKISLEEMFRMPWRPRTAVNQTTPKTSSLRKQTQPLQKEVPQEIVNFISYFKDKQELQRASLKIIEYLKKIGMEDYLKTFPKLADQGKITAANSGLAMSGVLGPFMADLPNLIKLIPYGVLSGILLPGIPKPWTWIFWPFVTWAMNNKEKPAAKALWTITPDAFMPSDAKRYSFKDFNKRKLIGGLMNTNSNS